MSCARLTTLVQDTRLPEGVHGVNVFVVLERKGRRRLTTESSLNARLENHEILHVEHPSRLARRQALRKAKYMLPVDFDAYYAAIIKPAWLRNTFVLRAKDREYYRQRTLPTGACWSVSVALAVTWTFIDIPTTAKITKTIANILVEAAKDQEAKFLGTVRTIVDSFRAIGDRVK